MPTTDKHLLTGAYALDALESAERAEFEAHLADCDECREELAGLQATAAVIGAASTTAAPLDLKARVLGEVARTRQDPPLLRLGGGPLLTPPLGVTRPDPQQPVDELAQRRARRSTRVVLAGLAASVAAVAVLGVGVVRLNQDLSDTRSRLAASASDVSRQQEASAAISRVMTAADSTTSTGKVTGGGHGTAVVSHSLGEGVFVAAGMPGIPSSETYQLWLIGSDGIRSMGTMDGAHASDPVVLSGLGAAKKIGVTVEPAGGSEQPTTTPIMLFDV